MIPDRPVSTAVLFLTATLALGAQTAGQKALELEGAGRHEEARAASAATILANPADVDAYVALTLALLSLERPADAELNARSGLLRYRDARLFEILGEACFALGKNEEALRNLQSSVSAAPEGPRAGLAFYYMGESYLRLGRFGHADMAFTTAIVFEPGRAPWWARLGWAREKAGETAGALEAYQKALSIDARLADAILGRERVAARLGG